MRRLCLATASVVALLLTACHQSASSPASSPEATSSSSPRDAHVEGVLLGIGGPAISPPQHWAGTIHVRGRASTTISTDRTGHFSVALPQGTYRFTATSPSYDGGHGQCQASGPVRVRDHATTRVRVVCQMK